MSDETGLRALLERIRRKAPSLTLRTTFIVGYPGETAAQFKRLLGFVKEGHFDYLGAFAYSKEEGTPAAKRPDQISEKLKQDRLAMLTNAYYDVAHAKAQQRIGTTETILLEETEGDTVLGRTRREAPEIDAIVRLPQSASRQGRFVREPLPPTTRTSSRRRLTNKRENLSGNGFGRRRRRLFPDRFGNAKAAGKAAADAAIGFFPITNPLTVAQRDFFNLQFGQLDIRHSTIFPRIHGVVSLVVLNSLLL